MCSSRRGHSRAHGAVRVTHIGVSGIRAAIQSLAIGNSCGRTLFRMSIRSDFIEGLLFADEDASLDFKREQYAFEGADKESKSELLKDVLAFVNAFRRADAYILIGVDETRGGRSTVVGVQEHLDDAKLQQFVNSKTQLPVTFSYRETSHDGLPVGVIHIPVQTRPVYATANYGKVTKEAVYIRRGSSTGVAKPEEIMRMGAAAVDAALQPTVRLHLVEHGTGKVLGDRVVVEDPTWIEVPPPGEGPGLPLRASGGSRAGPNCGARSDCELRILSGTCSVRSDRGMFPGLAGAGELQRQRDPRCEAGG